MLAVEDASCTVAPSEGRLTGSEKAYLSLTRACRHGYHTMSYLFGLNKLAKLMGGSISLEVPAHVLSLRYAEETPDDEESADPAEVPQLVSPEGTVSQEEPSPPDAAADAGKRAEGCTAADDDASTTAAEVAKSSGREQLQADFESMLWFTYRTGFPPLELYYLKFNQPAARWRGSADLRCRMGLYTAKLSDDDGPGAAADAGLVPHTMLRHVMAVDLVLRRSHAQCATALVMHYAGRVTEVTDTVRPVLARVATLFRDSPAPEHSFSVHAICAAGARHGLVAGKWMGPSPICRALQALADSNLAAALRVVTLHSRGGVPCLDPDQLAEHFTPADAAAQAGLYHPPERAPPCSSLLLLVPVVLGVDRLNGVYAEQLQAVLRLAQSVGIVGGRPGHSCYFVGYQECKLLGLDPHDMQATGERVDLATHSCAAICTSPITAIDSTVALGLYCHTQADLTDLCAHVEAMCASNAGAPLLCVGPDPPLLTHYTSTALALEVDDSLALGDESPSAAPRSRPSTSADDDWEVVAAAT